MIICAHALGRARGRRRRFHGRRRPPWPSISPLVISICPLPALQRLGLLEEGLLLRWRLLGRP